jgi:hypothetical protein
MSERCSGVPGATQLRTREPDGEIQRREEERENR